MNKFFKISLFIILVFTSIQCEEFSTDLPVNKWIIREFGYSIPLIADLRNDGFKRSYITQDDKLFELLNINGEWETSEICDMDLWPVIPAKCYFDGNVRLYGVLDESIYEVEYLQSNWSVKPIYTLKNTYPDPTICLRKGDTRNEGFESIFLMYSRTNSMPVFQWKPEVYQVLTELSCRNEKWEESFVDTTRSNLETIVDMTVGDGRGEGKDCIYLIDQFTELSEYCYETQSGWQRTGMGILKSEMLYADTISKPIIAVFPAHNGQPSLFVRTSSNLYELFFQNGNWEKSFFGSGTINMFQGGTGRNDGIYRIYCAKGDPDQDGSFLEFTFFNGSWNETTNIRMNTLTELAVGPGRGDGIHRIYIHQADKGTFELTYK